MFLVPIYLTNNLCFTLTPYNTAIVHDVPVFLLSGDLCPCLGYVVKGKTCVGEIQVRIKLYCLSFFQIVKRCCI